MKDSLNITQRRKTNIWVVMKTNILLATCLIAGFSTTTYALQLKEEKRLILIDPGHGGLDSGTISKEGLKEKEVVLDIAKSIIAWNKSMLDSKFEIYITRNKDTLISLKDRTKLSRHLKPAVFISLHCNHIENPSIKGLEIYTYKRDPQSLILADKILLNLHENLGFKIRPPKHANFHVLSETSIYCPALLLELGYLSNANESNYLIDKANKRALALAILMALDEVLNSTID